MSELNETMCELSLTHCKVGNKQLEVCVKEDSLNSFTWDAKGKFSSCLEFKGKSVIKLYNVSLCTIQFPVEPRVAEARRNAASSRACSESESALFNRKMGLIASDFMSRVSRNMRRTG